MSIRSTITWSNSAAVGQRPSLTKYSDTLAFTGHFLRTWSSVLHQLSSIWARHGRSLSEPSSLLWFYCRPELSPCQWPIMSSILCHFWQCFLTWILCHTLILQSHLCSTPIRCMGYLIGEGPLPKVWHRQNNFASELPWLGKLPPLIHSETIIDSMEITLICSFGDKWQVFHEF